MLKLARYLKYFKREVTIGPLFKFLEAVFELIVPLVMASIIDIGIKNRDTEYVLQRGGIILLLGLMGLIFAIICQYSAARASQGFGTMIRNDLYKHINSLSHAEIDSLGTDTLITILTNDINQMQLAVAMLIRLVVRAPFLVIGAVAMSMILDLKLSLIFLIVAPLVSLVIYIIMRLSVPYYRVRQRMLDNVSGITRENLSGARVIRAFSKQEYEIKRFNEANNEVADIAINVGRISAFLNPATFTILNLAILAILWFGGMRVDSASLTQGEVIAFVNYMTQISIALVVVANLVVIFTKASASAGRINRVFETVSIITDKDQTALDGQEINSRTYDKSFGQAVEDGESDKDVPIISLDRVSFAYPGSDEYALDDISFDINKGEQIGIIGGTGSGKSTLINLLARFYDVDKGEIRIEGIPVSEYSFDNLRGMFGIVPQKAVLFSGSIIDNLRLSKEDASIEEIERAIEIAQAKEFVDKLADGCNSQINQGGRNLSGGQRQRLTIARALVRNPRILILDDSSSALDYATDARLRGAISKNLKDSTIIIVSQRANAIKNCDQIIVLDDGRMVGIGKHEDLYQTCNIYREICDSQVS